MPQYEYLRDIFFNGSLFISEISRVEVLGYGKLSKDQEDYFSDIFSIVPIITPSKEIFDAAIEVRKMHNLKLGDSLIAATALVHKLEIYSRNIKDFERVVNLRCINPII